MFLIVLLLNLTNTINIIQSDSVKLQESQTHSFLEKVNFKVGYSGGFCYSGKDLAASSSIPGLIAPFYWANSLEATLVYHLNVDKGIKAGFGYGWINLSGGRGLNMTIPNEYPATGEAYITTSSWEITSLKGIIGLRLSNSFFTGITLSHHLMSTKEILNSNNSNIWPSDTTVFTIRKCIGGTVFCSWEGLEISGDIIRLKHYFRIQLGWAKEYTNDSPWEWDKKLRIGLSGVFAGLKLEIGGKL